MKFQVKRNSCDCHPETCNCMRWVVVDKKDKFVASFWHEEDAIKLVKLLQGSK